VLSFFALDEDRQRRYLPFAPRFIRSEHFRRHRSRRQEIVLIGPVCAGKSTVAQLLSSRLGVPWVDLDRIADPYYAAEGWTPERMARERKERGFLAFIRSWERVLP